MLRNLAVAAALIALIFVGLVLVARRLGDGGAPERNTVASPAARRAQHAMTEIATVSQGLMPEGYTAVYLSMPLAELRETRHAVRRSPRPAANNADTELWEEDDPAGARVMYLVGARSQLVTQAQFASRVSSPEELRGHFEAMQGRYGPPSGVWDCPETSDVPPLRRFTWRREGASVMEAVLMYGPSIALTLVVAANDDITRALSQSRCQRVTSREGIEAFPRATQLRGAQTPFVRELPRDR